MLSRNLKYFLLVLFFVPLVACQPAGQHYLNAVADKSTVIPLPAMGASQSTWQDMYLTLDHRVTVSDKALSIQGKTKFSSHPQIMYARFQNLKVSVFLLDNNNRVVAYQQILHSGAGSVQDEDSFNLRLERPAGVVAYTYGYEVGFIEGEPDTGGALIWSMPATDQ